VSNRAYLKVSCRNVTAETFPEIVKTFLQTVPFSATRRGFSQLALRAIETAEVPLIERDLRSSPATAEGVLEETGEFLQLDSSLELEAWWDLWVFDSATGAWTEQPQRLEIVCYGPEFEEGVWRESGHFAVDLGFEHLFTGHAGLLGANGGTLHSPQDPAEAQFIMRMSRPDALREYAERTRENIRRLQNWVQQIAQALPLDPGTGISLTSEGEEDFEARLDAIAS